MKIFSFNNSGEYALYNPSTDETILSSDNKDINSEADSLIAGWMDERNHNPVIKDDELLAAWNEYLRKSFKKEPITDKVLTSFLKSYKNPGWIVYTSTFEASNESIGSFTIWLVVLADTIIE
jgi:hypothetical protein